MDKPTRNRERSTLRVAWLVGICALCATAALADGIQLTAERGPAAFQVTLNWSGAAAPYEVYRSETPSDVASNPHLLATVPDPTFVDSPPDVPLLFYIVTQSSSCGNGIREAGEQCDDGNFIRLDGCGPDCRFEQLQRANWFKMQFTTDAICTRNRLGTAVVGLAQGQLQTAIDAGIQDGSTSLILTELGISDLSGTSEAAFPLGFIGGAPVLSGPNTYNGTSDLDWWYVISASSIDGSRQPVSSLSATIAAHNLTAGPGRVSVPLFPGGPAMTMSSTQVSITTGASSTPLVSSGDPPGHVASENLDPALTSYATCGVPTTAGSGRLCGDVVAQSLAAIPINSGLVANCNEGYTALNSMLDAFVGGCHALIFTLITPAQPDRTDPDAPVAGAGGPYTLSANAQHFVTTCRDRNNVVVDLATCLNSAAYSSFFKFATDRVIPK